MLGAQMAMADFLCWRHEGIWQLGAVCGWLSEGEEGQCWSSTIGKNATPVMYLCIFFFSPHRSCEQAEETDIFLIKTFQGGQYNGGGT